MSLAGGYDEHAGFDKSPFGSQYPGELLFVVRSVSEIMRTRS